jgi:hypothetical protein
MQSKSKMANIQQEDIQEIIQDFEKEMKDLENNLENNLNIKNNYKPLVRYIFEPVQVKRNIKKARRVITIAFNFDHQGNVKYGATIFKKEDNKEIFTKKEHRETAIERLKNNPKEFAIYNYNSKQHTPQVLSRIIRKEMYNLGV